MQGAKPAWLIEAEITTLKSEIKLSNPKLALKPVTIVSILIKKEGILGISTERYEVLKRKRKSRYESTCFFYVSNLNSAQKSIYNLLIFGQRSSRKMM